MPRRIWNEGRVVGYSAYEVYVKHAMSIDPDHEPATEKEWLASMMAMGSSMLLRIGTTEASYIDVEFPSDSRLCAANNIIASVFTGEGYVGTSADTEHVWCTKVTDYGPLIANASSSPSGNNVPISDTELSAKHKSYIREYMKIVDGIVLQPGTWTTNSNRPPQKDFTPTLAKVPTLRILFSEPITTPFFLLLTGFTNRSVVAGVTGFFDPQKAGDTGFGSAVNTQSPQDGDFLGPWAFPWAAKVIFSVPAAYINYFMNNKYSRQLKSGTPAIDVKSDAIIDMKQNYDGTASNYYETIDTDAPIEGNIEDINVSGEDAAILATYMHQSGGTKLPPALYGALVQTDGITKFIPIDTVAPGALKLYRNLYRDGKIDNAVVNKLKLLESAASGTTGFMRDDIVSTASYVVSQIDSAGVVIPVSDDTTIDLAGVMTVSTNLIYWFRQNPDTQGGPPTLAQMQTVREPIIQELHTGYISPDIISRYGVSYSEWTERTSELKEIGIDVFGEYWNYIDETDRDNYVAMLTGSFDYDYTGTKTCSYLLVNKRTGAYCALVPNILQSWSLPDFNFAYGATISGNTVKYNSAVTDFLGTWWPTTNSYVDINDNVIITRPEHKQLHEAVQGYDSFYLGSSLVPVYDDSKYVDFRYYFDDISFSTFLSKFGLTEDEVLGDNSGFKGLSLQKMLETAAMRDVTLPDTSDNYSSNIPANIKYIYDRDNWPRLNSDGTTNWSGPTMKCTIPAASSLYSMRFWKFEERPIGDIGKMDSLSSWTDITTTANRPDTHIWGSKGQSGHKETTSLSLVDKNGIRLPTSGTSKTISSDMITWDSLLQALNSNKSIDILGDSMKTLKSALNHAANGTYQISIKNGTVTLTKPE